MSKQFNSEWLEQFHERRKQNNPKPASSRPHTELQEPQAQQPKRVRLHKPKGEEANAVPRKRYRVNVVFLVSDKRTRDAFGMLETVADCLVRAVRRFNQGDS